MPQVSLLLSAFVDRFWPKIMGQNLILRNTFIFQVQLGTKRQFGIQKLMRLFNFWTFGQSSLKILRFLHILKLALVLLYKCHYTKAIPNLKKWSDLFLLLQLTSTSMKANFNIAPIKRSYSFGFQVMWIGPRGCFIYGVKPILICKRACILTSHWCKLQN